LSERNEERPPSRVCEQEEVMVAISSEMKPLLTFASERGWLS
jgi:hypothetical protein